MWLGEPNPIWLASLWEGESRTQSHRGMTMKTLGGECICTTREISGQPALPTPSSQASSVQTGTEICISGCLLQQPKLTDTHSIRSTTTKLSCHLPRAWLIRAWTFQKYNYQNKKGQWCHPETFPTSMCEPNERTLVTFSSWALMCPSAQLLPAATPAADHGLHPLDVVFSPNKLLPLQECSENGQSCSS